MADIDEFIIDRLVRKFGNDVWGASLEGMKAFGGFGHREITTEELDEKINHTTQAILNYYKNKKLDPNSINTQPPPKSTRGRKNDK